MIGSRLLVALGLVGAAALACTPVCDEPGLRRAAELSTTGPDRRQAGIEALRDACPTLPAALARGLLADAAPDDSARDQAWQALLARTCPGAAQASEATRRRCDLDRHGLLAADAVYARADLDVFMLFQWLVDGRVDRALASQVALPLLTASQLAAWELSPPRSRHDVAPQGAGPRIRLSPTAVMVDDAPVLALERGRPAPGEFTRHVSPALRGALVTAARDAQARVARADRPWPEVATILADRATPFATLADVLFTASKAGVHAFELIVDDGEDLRGRPISAPLAWLPPDDIIRERTLEVVFVVHADTVVARVEGGRETRFTRPVGAALAAHVVALKRLYPNETVASLRVDGEVPLQAVVSLMDAVAGERCALRGAFAGEAVPDDCLFWQHSLDLEPPLHRDADREPE